MQNHSKLTRIRLWSKEEDDKLRWQINATGKLNWEIVARNSGLKRSANSCRLRWENHLKPGFRPDCKLTDEEKLLILEYRSEYGRNRWSKIAKHLLPGRRDNDVKNYWHSLAKRAKREGRDVDNHAFLKRVELMETIKASGKLTMDYSSSILPAALNKLKELLPDLPVAEVAGSFSITTGAVSSASDLGTSNDLASSLAATDIGAADAVTSCCSLEFGTEQVGYSDGSNIGPTEEVDRIIFQEQSLGGRGFNPSSTPTEINNSEEQGLVDHGGGPTGFNQVQAAAFNGTSTETSNQGWNPMKVTTAPACNTFVDAPQFRAPAEQHQQLRFFSEFIDFDLTELVQAEFSNIDELDFN